MSKKKITADRSDDKEEAGDRQPASRREQDRENPLYRESSSSVSSLNEWLFFCLFSVIRIDFDSS